MSNPRAQDRLRLVDEGHSGRRPDLPGPHSPGGPAMANGGPHLRQVAVRGEREGGREGEGERRVEGGNAGKKKGGEEGADGVRVLACPDGARRRVRVRRLSLGCTDRSWLAAQEPHLFMVLVAPTGPG